MEETVQKAMEWGALCRHVPQAVCSEPPGWGSGECDGDAVDFLVAERNRLHGTRVTATTPARCGSRSAHCHLDVDPRPREKVLLVSRSASPPWALTRQHPKAGRHPGDPTRLSLAVILGARPARIFFLSGTHHIHNHTFYVREWLFKTVFNSESELIVRMQGWF